MTIGKPDSVTSANGDASMGRPVIRCERRVTWPRLRYIVTGERGAVEYMTLAGFPLAISYHSPRPLDRVRAVPCDILGGPCYADGTITGAGELCERWLAAGKDEQVIWGRPGRAVFPMGVRSVAARPDGLGIHEAPGQAAPRRTPRSTAGPSGGTDDRP
jgi:hypothetical protein